MTAHLTTFQICYIRMSIPICDTETHKFNTASNMVQKIEQKFLDVSMSSGSLCVSWLSKKGLFVQCKILGFCHFTAWRWAKRLCTGFGIESRMLALTADFHNHDCQGRNEQLRDWVHRFMVLASNVFAKFCSIMIECRILPVDPSGWQVSVKSANYVAAMLANTLRATESVLRIAAVGSDSSSFWR